MGFGWEDAAIGASTGGLYNAVKYMQGGYDNKSGGGGPDISGELARLSAMMQSVREQQEKSINRQAGLGRTAAASNLAARGIYSSPVSENTFGRLESDRLQAIGDANAQITAQEASLRAGLLSQLLGYNQAEKMRQEQIKAGRVGQMFNIGSSVLMAALMRNPAPLMAQGAGAMGGGGGSVPFSPQPNWQAGLDNRFFPGGFGS